jgi:hypothetical protein
MAEGFLAALTRRASLMTLGTAGVTALAGPFAGKAKNKKKHKHKSGDVNKLCKTQVDPCISTLTPGCDDAFCVVTIRRCCQFFGTCDVTGFITCVAEASGGGQS